MKKLVLLLSIISVLGFAVYRILVSMYCEDAKWNCYGQAHWFISEFVIAVCVAAALTAILCWLIEIER